MVQIVKFFQCKTCSAINQDWKWQHSTMSKMDATSYTTRESIYCPNCLHTEYEEIEYKDLPKLFIYHMNKQRIEDSLKNLENGCESKEEFLEIMNSLGYTSLEL